jgi:hypothetical protein
MTTPLLTLQTPVVVVLLVTAFATARGRRCALPASLRVHRSGLRRRQTAVTPATP